MVVGFAKYSKKSNETQLRYTLKNINAISRGVQNGCVCNLLLFRQVGRLRSMTLLIVHCIALSIRVLTNGWTEGQTDATKCIISLLQLFSESVSVMSYTLIQSGFQIKVP